MAIEDVNPRVQYIASSAQTNFLYVFRIFDAEDLKVYSTPVGQIPDPNIDLIVLNVDYTVTGVGNDNGGDVILVVPSTAGNIITIERDIIENRPDTFDFKIDGKFTAEQLNNNLDKITMLLQQNEALLKNRGLLYPVTEQLDSGQTTLPKLPAGYIWKANGSGNIVAALIDENPDWSTLRSELISQSPSAPGTDAVGSYNANLGGGQSTTDYLNKLYTQSYITIIDNIRKGDYIKFTISYITPGEIDQYKVTLSFLPTQASFFVVGIGTASTNTGAATLSINEGTPIPIRNQQDVPLIGGELKTGSVYWLYKGSTSWLIMSAQEIASKTIMEATATDNFIATPGNMIYHPNVIKVKAIFSQGAGLPYEITTIASSGVSSITSWLAAQPGRIRINFAVNFANTNYEIMGMAGENILSPNEYCRIAIHNKTIAYVDLAVIITNSDFKPVHVADVTITGELA